MKYIIIQDQKTGYYYPITFSEDIVHLHVGLVAIAMKKEHKNCKVIGAGFVKQLHQSEKWEVYGNSESLDIGPSPIDCEILNAFLVQNLSGLSLMNYLQFLEIQRNGKL